MQHMFPFVVQAAVPEILKAQMRRFGQDGAFTRRAVLVREGGDKPWVYLGCVLRPADARMAGDQPGPEVIPYDDALLVSDILSVPELELFLLALQQGKTTIAGIDVGFQLSPGCEVQHVSVENIWMEQAGYVYSFRSSSHLNQPFQERLLKQGAPYFPDVFEAAGCWLGLRQYHGSSDGRKGYVVVLVPETRAVISAGVWKSEDELEVHIAGPAVGASNLSIVGAAWLGKSIVHFERAVPSDGRLSLRLPARCDRLEMFLLDSHGETYDFHTESLAGYVPSRSFLGKKHGKSSADRVLKAIAEGEGLHTEFKEFLDLEKPKVPSGDKDKFTQVLKCVAAFANTKGGTIFLGISDDCEVVGVNEHVSKWVDAALDEAVVEVYIGALRSKLRDRLNSAVSLHTEAIYHRDRLVIALDVSEGRLPVSIHDDNRLWQRRQSSNISVPPADWVGRNTDLFNF